MTYILFNTQSHIGRNRVSSSAIAYDKHTTYETLVEGAQVEVKMLDEDWEDDGITGHSSFEDMVKFHKMSVNALEALTGLKAE